MKMRILMCFKLLVFTTTIIILVKANNFQPFYAEMFFKQGSDNRCVNTFASFRVPYISKCALLCQRDISCFGFNYEGLNSSCQLVADWAIHNVKLANGWTIYRKVPRDYVRVGTYYITISTNVQMKADAALACEPIGRLVQIDTVEKFYTITTYLESLSPIPLNIWTDGSYDSNDNTWKLADGSLLPNDTAILYSDMIHPTCIRLKYSGMGPMYKLNDINCIRAFPYMCELV